MEGLWNALTRLARVAILAGGSLLFIAALIVTAEVLVRKAIPDLITFACWIIPALDASGDALKIWIRDNMTFSGSDEISGYLFAVGTSWGLAHVLISRGHVRIDALYGMFGPRLRALLDIFALILLAVFVGALLERAFNVASTNLIEYNRSNTNLRIPLSWAQVPWMLGIALFFLTTIVAIGRSLAALVRGDLAVVNAIAGASSQDEEIEQEIKGLGLAKPQEGKH